MTKCETIMVGACPETGAMVQLIDVDCMAAPEGVKVHDALDGSRYWCRPFPPAA